MSKAFKILVDIIIAVCIIAVVAVLVPPLVGVRTEVAAPKMDRNIVEGAVAYGVRRPAATLNPGDQIIYSDETYMYLYTVDEVDSDNGEVHVTDPATSEQLVLQISKNTTKKVLIVPFIGYILLALQSWNGIAMLISAAVALIALYIIATLWRSSVKKKKGIRRKKDEEDEEYFTALAQSVDKPGKLEEAYRRIVETGTLPAAAVQAETADAPTIAIPVVGAPEAPAAAPTDFVEELEEYEQLEESAAAGAEAFPAEAAAAASLGAAASAAALSRAQEEKEEEKTVAAAAEKKDTDHREAAKKDSKPALEISGREQKQRPDFTVSEQKPYDTANLTAAFAEIPDDDSPASLNISDRDIPDVSDALVAALDTTQVSRSERTYQQAVPQPEEPQEPAQMDEIELAIPVRSANEILDAAYAKGYDPQVITDDVTGVKLIDFSDCL